MSEIGVQLTDVEVRAEEKVILRVPKLTVTGGGFLGIVGSKGAGKSTLLKVCALAIEPDRGEVTLDGKRVQALSNWQLAHLKRDVALMPARDAFFPDASLTVREIIADGRVGPTGRLSGPTDADREAVESWIDRLELATVAGANFHNLDGRGRQMTLLARALVREPSILLLDEPAAGLTTEETERVDELLEEVYAERDVTAILATHETGFLPACTTEVALVSCAELLDVGPREAVFTSENLTRLYGCPIDVLEMHGRHHAVATMSWDAMRRGHPGAD